MLKILDKYILKLFIIFLILTLFAGVSIILLIEFIDDLDQISKHHVSLGTVLEYLFYQIPSSLSHIIPLAVVISIQVLLIILTIHHELVAIQASGIPRLRLAGILLGSTIFICIIYWGLNNYLVPQSVQQAKYVRTTKILNQPSSGYVADQQTWLRGPSGEFYSVGLVGTQAKFLLNIQIMKLYTDGHGFISDTQIQQATWDEKSKIWKIDNFKERVFDSQQRLVREITSQQTTMQLAFIPNDFTQVVQTPEQMTTNQLRYHIDLLKQGGLDTRESMTVYHLRLANALGPLILAIIGICYGFVMTRMEVASGIAQVLVLAILYTILTQLGIKLGSTGIIPPFWSAWLSNILVGGWSLIKLHNVLNR